MSKVVIFKHEDDADGVPIGPATVYDESELDPEWGSPTTGRPFDPSRPPQPFVTIHEAQAIAREHDAELREV